MRENCLIGFVRSAVFKLSIVLFLSSSSSFSKAISVFLCGRRKADVREEVSLQSCARGVGAPAAWLCQTVETELGPQTGSGSLKVQILKAIAGHGKRFGLEPPPCLQGDGLNGGQQGEHVALG